MHEGHLIAQGTPDELAALASGRCFDVELPAGTVARTVQAALLDDTAAVADAVPAGGLVHCMLRTRCRRRKRCRRALALWRILCRPPWRTVSCCCCANSRKGLYTPASLTEYRRTARRETIRPTPWQTVLPDGTPLRIRLAAQAAQPILPVPEQAQRRQCSASLQSEPAHRSPAAGSARPAAETLVRRMTS